MCFFWFLPNLFYFSITYQIFPQTLCCGCLVMVSLTSARWWIRSRMNSFIMFWWLFFFSFPLSLHTDCEHHCYKTNHIINYLQWSPKDNLTLKAFFVFLITKENLNYERARKCTVKIWFYILNLIRTIRCWPSVALLNTLDEFYGCEIAKSFMKVTARKLPRDWNPQLYLIF